MVLNRSSILEKLIKRLIPYSWVILVFFVILTYRAAPRAIKLISTVNTEISNLLPSSYPTIKLSNEINEKFKEQGTSGGNLIVVGQSPHRENNYRAYFALVKYLQNIPEVKSVNYEKKYFDFFDEHKLLYIDLEDLKEIQDRVNRKIQQEKLRGLYIDFEKEEKEEDPFDFDDLIEKYRQDHSTRVANRYFMNADETAFAITINPRSNDSSLKYYKEFYDLIDQKIKEFPLNEYGVEVSYAGSINTRIIEYSSLMSDLKKAGLISFLGIFFLLFIYLRRVLAVILLLVPLCVGILVGFYICSFFISSMNIVTAFLFSILVGLGIDIGIHFFARYEEDRKEGMSQEQALVNVLLKTGRSAATSVLTTCATFFILVINDFKGFSEFGWIAGIGLLSILVCYLVLFPALIILPEKWGILRCGKQNVSFFHRWLNGLKEFPHANKIFAGCLLILIISLVLFPWVRFEWNYQLLKMKVEKTEQAKEKLKTIYGSANSPAVILINGEEDARVLKAEFDRRKRLPDQYPTIHKFRSSYSLYPEDQEEKVKVLHDIDRLLDDDALNVVKGEKRNMMNDFREAIRQTTIFKKSEVPPDTYEGFYGKGPYKNEQLSFVYPDTFLELDDGKNAIAFYKDAHHVNINGKDYYAVSNSMVFAEVIMTMMRDSKRAILLSVLVLILIVYMDFRSWKNTMVIMGSLFFGIIVMGGCVVLFGWKFNFYNMVTIPVVLGMGVDNSVYMMHSFYEQKNPSVIKAWVSSGFAASMASLTTMLGYSGLVVAHHPGLESIGNFAIIGMAACMLGSLVFLPAVMQKYFVKK